MKKYLKYLKYVVRHKWFVLQECFKIGLYWRGITHDMSKFMPSEFIPYARYFYGNYPTEDECKNALRCGVSLGKSKEEVEHDFNLAWLKHIHRNEHHHQHWILREDSGNVMELDMEAKVILEMLCDWRGAGKAIHGFDETEKWYNENKDKMHLSKQTRNLVETLLA